MSMHGTRFIEKGGVRLNLPKNLKGSIRGGVFVAASRDGAVSLIIDVDPVSDLESAYMNLARGQLGVNPTLSSTVLDSAEPSLRSMGTDLLVLAQRVVQHSRDGYPLSYGWVVNCHWKGHFVHIQVQGPGAFRDTEPMWRHVLESIELGEC